MAGKQFVECGFDIFLCGQYLGLEVKIKICCSLQATEYFILFYILFCLKKERKVNWSQGKDPNFKSV